jgi:hypothetical protein
MLCRIRCSGTGACRWPRSASGSGSSTSRSTPRSWYWATTDRFNGPTGVTVSSSRPRWAGRWCSRADVTTGLGRGETEPVPTVGHRRRSAQRRGGLTAEHDGWTRALHGPGVRIDVTDRHPSTLVPRLVHGPQRRQRAEVFFHPRAAFGHRHPAGGELGGEVAGGEARDEPTSGDHVHAGQLFGENRRCVQRQHDDAGADPDGGGVRRDQRQGHDGVQERQRGRLAEAGRLRVGQHDVLTGPDRLEPGRLGVQGHAYRQVRIGAGPVVDRKQSHLHGWQR